MPALQPPGSICLLKCNLFSYMAKCPTLRSLSVLWFCIAGLLTTYNLEAQCTGCGTTITINSPFPLNVGSGQNVCISGNTLNYTGTINITGTGIVKVINNAVLSGPVNISNTGTLCIAGGSSVTGSVTENGGTIQVYGNFSPSAFAYTSGTIVNNATAVIPANVTQLLLNAAGETITNNSSGTLTINRELKLDHASASLLNYGVINMGTSAVNITQNLNKNKGTVSNFPTGLIRASSFISALNTTTNNGTINCKLFNLAGGTATNTGTITVTNSGTGDFSISASTALTNNSQGLITVERNLTSLGTITLGNGSKIMCANLGNLGTISGPALNAGCGVIQVAATSTNSGTINGYADICDATPPPGVIKIDNPAGGVVASTVMFCNCCVLSTATVNGPASICPGVNTTLTAVSTPTPTPAVSTYSWNTGATTAAIIVAPLTATTYTVTLTYANACTKTATKTLSMLPPPVVNAGPDNEVPPGGSIVIGGSPTASGGNGAPYTYSWNPAATVSPSNVANPTATPAATTTYTVTVSDVSGCTASDNMVLTVPPPYYATPQKYPDAGYYTLINNKAYFSFYEEYAETVTGLTYSIYNDVHVPVSATLTPSVEVYGDNRFALDMSALAAGYYTLEISNEKNEKWYIRFKK